MQKLILSGDASNHDRARDMIAGLITRHQGEYIFRLGLQPPLAKLYAGEDFAQDEGWRSIARTEFEIDTLRNGVTTIVEEVGGKVRFSLTNFRKCLLSDGGQTSVLFETQKNHPRMTLLLRLPPLNVSLTPEVRCAVVGNVDSGKSTTLGVLTRGTSACVNNGSFTPLMVIWMNQGTLDDGRGRARVSLFRHKHEIETGRTSSVGMEILGFSPNGAPILPSLAPNTTDPDVIRREKLGWEEISMQAAKIVSFIDLAGHERYLKTTLYGLTSGAPSCVILMVGANAGLVGMSKEHLAIALALSVPVVVCITKVNLCEGDIAVSGLTDIKRLI